MAEKLLAKPIVPPVPVPIRSVPPAVGAGARISDVDEKVGGVDVIVGRREEEEVGVGRREGVEEVGVGRKKGEATPVADEKEEVDQDEGNDWLTGTVVVGGDFPRREGGTILGASSEGSSFPRTLSAMRNSARANCSAFSLPRF